MRHRKAGLKLNRTPSHRQAMFRNMVTSLFKYERIRTTGAKAKEVSRWADHLITLAKRGDLHARRQALAIVREKEVVHKLFEHASERFGTVSGGYTRVIKLGLRPGDAAPMSLVELIAIEDTKKKKAKKKKAKTQAKQKKKTTDPKSASADKNAEEAKTKKPSAEKEDKLTDKEEGTAVETKETASKDTVKKAEKKESKGKTESNAEVAKEDKPVKKAKAAPAKKTEKAETEKKKSPAKKSDADEK
jgi:large subunit ribosomal protein L17